MRQAEFRISKSICVIWTQLLLDARTRYPFSAHRRLWSDCASVIRLQLAHMYFVKNCFVAAYKCQPSSFFGHTVKPRTYVLLLAVIRVGVDVARQTKSSYIVLTLQSMLYTYPVVANITIIIFHIFVSSCRLFVLIVRQCFIMQLPLGYILSPNKTHCSGKTQLCSDPTH